VLSDTVTVTIIDRTIMTQPLLPTVFRFILAAIVAMTSLVPFAASAVTPAPTGPGGGMEIAPVLIEISAKPGQSVTTSIRLRNVTKTPFVVTPHMDDFIAKGENGEPQVLADGKYAETGSMSRWIASPGDVLLEPNVFKTVAVTINVPKNAEPGGHYGVIRFAPDQAQGTGKTGVSISASVGSLILLTVSGKVKESLSYLQFKAGTKSGPMSFFEKGPITFTQRVHNDGNVHEKPTGQVVILTSSGRKVAGLPINEKGGNILPGSARAFTEQWKTNAMFGHYTATAHLAYANGKTLESPVVSFWIIPFKLIGLILLGLLILFGVLKLLGKRYSFSISKAKR
jgi:hypothetical protein